MCHYVSQHRHTHCPINSSTLALGTQDLMLPYCVLITKVDSNYISFSPKHSEVGTIVPIYE